MLQNPKEKEFVDSELARDYISKLLMEVVIDLGLNLIVKISFLYSGFFFFLILFLTLRKVRLNLPQVFEIVGFISFLGSSYRTIFYFLLLRMI